MLKNISNYAKEDEMNEILSAKWSSECCGEPNCWCEIITPENNKNKLIIGPGVLSKEYARHIVDLHNKFVDANIPTES